MAQVLVVLRNLLSDWTVKALARSGFIIRCHLMAKPFSTYETRYPFCFFSIESATISNALNKGNLLEQGNSRVRCLSLFDPDKV